jgi:gas vesicle protein
MTMISTLVTGWLIGATAAAAAPLPSYDVLGDRVAVERSAPAPRPSPAQVKEKDKEEKDARKEREDAQKEAAREQREAQREQWKAQVRAQQDRVRAQRERQQREWVEIEGERVVKTFSVGRTGSLLLHNMSGDVVITAGGGSEVRVEAIKRAKGRSQAEARQQLENVVLTIQDAGGRVDVRAEPRGREARAWVDFNVIVPYEASAEVHSVSGDISVTGVKGEVRAETVSGTVKASGLTRLASMKSVSGDVELNGVESDGTVVLSSVSGDVTATNLKARGLDVSAVSGDTTLNQCQTDRAQVNTVNGDITYSGRLSKAGRYELKTHSGNITLNHQGSPFEVAASTFSGDIKFDQPLPATVKANTNRYGPGRSVRGTVGNGGAYVELTTFSGDILVGKDQQ